LSTTVEDSLECLGGLLAKGRRFLGTTVLGFESGVEGMGAYYDVLLMCVIRELLGNTVMFRTRARRASLDIARICIALVDSSL
jgi:hypothetical protein